MVRDTFAEVVYLEREPLDVQNASMPHFPWLKSTVSQVDRASGRSTISMEMTPSEILRAVEGAA
jgi:hypothetical protein